ncbi:MAG: DUF3667 domain-containing protein [Chitinophagales bacterium]
MSKINRRQAICSNCSHSFTENTANNFCPNCGQENSNKNVSFGELFSDFVGSYFSLDSKLFRTIPRLLFSPGFLTNAFNDGKRIRYLTPIRIYLFMSVLYFSFFAAQFSGTKEIISNGDRQERIDSILNIAAKDSVLISNTTFLKDVVDSDSIVITNDTVGEEGRKRLKIPNNDLYIGLSFPEEDSTFIQEQKVRRVIRLSKKYGIDATIDTLRQEDSFLTQNTFFTKGTRQFLRIYHQGSEDLAAYFFARLPLMMLFTLPIFAFIFKLLYIRRKRHYIEHVVFLLHFHAFLYIVLTVLLWTSDYLSEEYIALILMGIFVYFLIALKKVYQQSWKKSVMKGVVFNLFYPICLGVAVVATGIVAFLMF